jgi:MoxR-like ATPase
MGKELFLLRGLPGSGKTTLAGSLEMVFCYEADRYFEDEDGKYNFDPTKLKQAHQWCQDRVEKAMSAPNGFPPPRIVVSNTFTQEWEMDPYYKLAEQYGYRVYSLVVENRHEGVNEHGVSADKLEQMKNRFEIKL